MRPMKILRDILESLANPEHYLFTVSDFLSLFPDMTTEGLRVLLGRAEKAGLLCRLCRGIYIYPKAGYRRGLELYHAAARLRETTFCYLSFESILSENGIISQIPLGWITLMTGGRSGTINCGKWGTIEFIHTKKKFDALSSSLIYDHTYRLWRAPVTVALQDMKTAKRSMELIDWSVFNSGICAAE
jgi:predicted transcriptional regulator of viral defense system